MHELAVPPHERVRLTTHLVPTRRGDRLADRVTVIRGGRRIATRPVGELTPRSLAELMAGEETETEHRPRPVSDPAEAVLEVRGLSAGSLHGVDFTLARGERLGITGLVGAAMIAAAVWSSIVVQRKEDRTAVAGE